MNQLRKISHIVCLLSIIELSCAVTNSVFTYKPYGQIGQTVTSSTLAWETYVSNDERQQEFAVHGGKYISEDENYAAYVCRVQIEGIWTAGNTKKESNTVICVATMHNEVRRHRSFEVLINKGGGGKITWQPWNKFSGSTPPGAVSCGNGHTDDNFVARHKIKHTESGEHKHHHGNDYNVGSFDSKKKLVGRIVASSNGNEHEFDEGEILVETEPFSYELRQIKLDKWRTRTSRNTTILGTTILSNSDLISNSVETVITYDFDKSVYWGTHDGVARGLPTKVYDNPRHSININWGLENNEKVIETKAVNTILQPGTAINVTMKGNYTETEAPYTATLIAYYADNSDSVSRVLNAYVQKKEMLDVKIEFSPVYWISNLTLVPTTTTTTTTTTTSTTEPTTTSTKEPIPLPETPRNEVIEDEIVPESQETLDRSNEKLEGSNLDPAHGSAGVNKRLLSVMCIPVFYTILIYFI